MTDEIANSALNPDDTDAEGDLSRRLRAQEFRQSRRSQISTLIPALLFIGFGALLLVNPSELTPALTLGLAVGAVGLSLLARFLLNGRSERGLCFVGVTLLLWLGFAASVFTGRADVVQVWPLLISSFGLAALITFLFERDHERGVILPGLLVIFAGGVALLFTLQIVSSALLTTVAAYWPLVFLIPALILLARAFRPRSASAP